jgi:hypothetical protein
MNWIVDDYVVSNSSKLTNSSIIGAVAGDVFGQLRVFLSTAHDGTEKELIKVYIAQVIAGISNVDFLLIIPRYPKIIFISSSLAVATGSSKTIILGTKFGTRTTSLFARLQSSAYSSTEWKSDSVVECRCASMSSNSKMVTLTIQMSSFVDLDADFRRLPNLLNSSEINVKLGIPVNIPSTGAFLMLQGFDMFGLHDSSDSARIGSSSLAVSQWYSDSSLCVYPAKIGLIKSQYAFTITHSKIAMLKFFKVPNDLKQLISYVAAQTTIFVDSITGSYEIHAHGIKFGFSDATLRIRASFSDCEHTHWTSASNLDCKLPPTQLRAMSRLVVTVEQSVADGLLDSIVQNPSSAVKTVSSVDIVATGNQNIFMAGKNFLNFDTTISSRQEQSACMKTIWVSSSVVAVKTHAHTSKAP